MASPIYFFWIITALAFWIYSYGFVDLNLTLSDNPVLFNFVSLVQQLVYFDRPLSLNVYLVLIISVFILYIGSLHHWSNGKNTLFPWKLIAAIALIFSLSYPAFSSDIFKYLFSARMVVEYDSNPHLIPPNTFPDDTWIRFMRWVHTPSPYGPVFTAMAIPYYLAGFGKFIPTLYLYKLGMIFWYLLSVWLVGRLAAGLDQNARRVTLARLFFALNPLVLTEWLGSSHNDGPMIALLLLSIYLLTLRRRALSVLSLLMSIGIKFVTLVAFPLIFLVRQFKPKSFISYSMYYFLAAFTVIPLVYHYSFQYQPWYVTWLVPFAAVLGSPAVLLAVGGYTFGSLLRYIPFVAEGVWSATPLQFALYSFIPPFFTVFIYFVWTRLRKL